MPPTFSNPQLQELLNQAVDPNRFGSIFTGLLANAKDETDRATNLFGLLAQTSPEKAAALLEEPGFAESLIKPQVRPDFTKKQRATKKAKSPLTQVTEGFQKVKGTKKKVTPSQLSSIDKTVQGYLDGFVQQGLEVTNMDEIRAKIARGEIPTAGDFILKGGIRATESQFTQAFVLTRAPDTMNPSALIFQNWRKTFEKQNGRPPNPDEEVKFLQELESNPTETQLAIMQANLLLKEQELKLRELNEELLRERLRTAGVLSQEQRTKTQDSIKARKADNSAFIQLINLANKVAAGDKLALSQLFVATSGITNDLDRAGIQDEVNFLATQVASGNPALINTATQLLTMAIRIPLMSNERTIEEMERALTTGKQPGAPEVDESGEVLSPEEQAIYEQLGIEVIPEE
jgi:hypothetical protein